MGWSLHTSGEVEVEKTHAVAWVGLEKEASIGESVFRLGT